MTIGAKLYFKNILYRCIPGWKRLDYVSPVIVLLDRLGEKCDQEVIEWVTALLHA